MKEATKLIKPSEKHVNKQLYTGLALIALGVVFLFMGAIGAPFGIGVLFVIIALVSKNTDMIKVYDNYFEIKLAPLAARRFIKISEITNVDTSNPKILMVYYDSEGKNKKIKIPKAMFNDKDFQFVTEFVSAKKAA